MPVHSAEIPQRAEYREHVAAFHGDVVRSVGRGIYQAHLVTGYTENIGGF